jgi:serine/threonine protein kinase
MLAATGVPITAVVLFVLVALLVGLILFVIKRQGDVYDWEIRFDELELGEPLGAGGFGEVHRATWKGTDVAVKVMASERVTKEMEKSFKEEVRVMTSLRHPNVVLFMAACTKAPKMCIVMEFMSLGCLYDVTPFPLHRCEVCRHVSDLSLCAQLLHNELIPHIPFMLKAKMAYQASKGMHFLHSSGTSPALALGS